MNALETLTVTLRAVLQKGMSGWELMEVLAGNVNESDLVFAVSSLSPVVTPSTDRFW